MPAFGPLIRMEAAAIGPARVSVFPAVASIVLGAVMWSERAVVNVPLECRVPPPRVTEPDAAPRLASADTFSVPPLTTVPPA